MNCSAVNDPGCERRAGVFVRRQFSVGLHHQVSRLHTELTDLTQICQVGGAPSRETGAHSETDGQSSSSFPSKLQDKALTNKIKQYALFYSP